MRTHKAYRILVIDDNPDIHEDFRKILAADDALAGQLARVGGGSARHDARPARCLPRFDLDCARQGEEGLAHLTRAHRRGPPLRAGFCRCAHAAGWDGIETIAPSLEGGPRPGSRDLHGVLRFFRCTDIARRLQRPDQLLVLKKPFDDIEVQQLAVALSEKWRLAREAQSYFDNLEALVKARTAELEQSLSRIQASENQYRLLFESNPTPIFTYDQTTLAFVSVNEAAVRHYGYSREEFLRLTLRDLALPEDLPRFLDKLSNLAPGAGNSGVWRHRTKDGKWTEMEITSHLLQPGQTLFVPGHGRDGTPEPGSAIAPVAKNGVRRPTGRRHRPRFQQSPHRHQRPRQPASWPGKNSPPGRADSLKEICRSRQAGRRR